MELTLTNNQDRHPIDSDSLLRAVSAVLADSSYSHGAVDLAVVDDAEMQQLNRRYLDHDWPTDVLSFPLETVGDRLEGQIVVSADTAAREAVECGWSMGEELLLYAIHGSLHLLGYTDKDSTAAAEMYAAEARYLAQLGVEPSRAGRFAAEGGLTAS